MTKGLSVGLRPGTAAGQYQGMATTGTALTMMLPPVIMISLLITWGIPGLVRPRRPLRGRRQTAMPATIWALRHRPAGPG